MSRRMILVLALIFLAAVSLPVRPDPSSINQWDVEYWISGAVPVDIQEDPQKPGIAQYWESPIDIFEYPEFPLLPMPPELRGKVREALLETLNPLFVTDELLDFTMIWDRGIMFNPWRMGVFSHTGYVFRLSFTVDDTRVFVFGALDDGLTEAIVFTSCQSIEEFNEKTHCFLNIPESASASLDYRPIRFQFVSVGPPFAMPDPECDYTYDGYIINSAEGDSAKMARNIERIYLKKVTSEKEILQTIEFSVRYTPGQTNQPPIVDAGPDKSTIVLIPVVFVGTCIDPDGDPIVDCYWDFGDGTTYPEGCNEEVSHTYLSTGEFTATLWAFDSQEWGYDECVVIVNAVNEG